MVASEGSVHGVELIACANRVASAASAAGGCSRSNRGGRHATRRPPPGRRPRAVAAAPAGNRRPRARAERPRPPTVSPRRSRVRDCGGGSSMMVRYSRRVRAVKPAGSWTGNRGGCYARGMRRGERRPGGAPLVEVAAVFLRLGLTAFGGPAAHVAIMERETVVRRRWLPRERFLDLLAIANVLPGPSSSELAIYLGYVRAGWAGLVVVGVYIATT